MHLSGEICDRCYRKRGRVVTFALKHLVVRVGVYDEDHPCAGQPRHEGIALCMECLHQHAAEVLGLDYHRLMAEQYERGMMDLKVKGWVQERLDAMTEEDRWAWYYAHSGHHRNTEE